VLNTEDQVDEVDGLVSPPPKMDIGIKSRDMMEITITKTVLDVFSNLAASFTDAYKLVERPRMTDEVQPPYLVRNESGIFITLTLDSTLQVDIYIEDSLL